MSQQAPSSYVPFRLIQLKLFRLPASCSLFHALVLPIPVHLSRFGRHPGPQRKTVCTKKGSLLKKRRRRTQKKKKKKVLLLYAVCQVDGLHRHRLLLFFRLPLLLLIV